MTDAGSRTTVVVANNDETVCEVLARVVEASGREVIRVTDTSLVGGAVLSAPAQAVVLDLGADNVDQLRALRSEDSPRGLDARAVAICTGPAAALLAWQAGTDAVLTRPFAATELAAVLDDVLARADDERHSVRADHVSQLSS